VKSRSACCCTVWEPSASHGHEEIKQDCAPVYSSLWAAYKEIIPAVVRQLRDQEYYVRRELLPGAAPFNEPTPLSDGRALPLATVTAG